VRLLHLVRPALLLVPGFALLLLYYSLDYPYPDSGAFPAHVWSTAGAIAGWLLVLTALVLINASPLTTWVALFSAIAVGAVGVDSDGQVSRDLSTWIGVAGSCLVFVIVTARTLVNAFGLRRARVYSFAACVIGVGTFLLNSLYPQSPIWNGPPSLLLAALVVTPAFVLLRRPYFWSKPVSVQTLGQPDAAHTTTQQAPDSTLVTGSPFDEEASTSPASASGQMSPDARYWWDGQRWRDVMTTSGQLTPQDQARFGPPKSFWLAGCPWWGWVYFFAFAWSVNDIAQPLLRAGANNYLAYGAAIVVLILVVVFIAIFGRRIYIGLQPWLDITIGDWQRLDTKALALQKSANVDAPSDANLAQAEALYRQALNVAEAGERPLLIATASNNLAGVYGQEGRIPEAILLFERALQLRKAYAGENSKASVNSLQRLEAARQAYVNRSTVR
jgi:tetratricopeptide repeat protein